MSHQFGKRSRAAAKSETTGPAADMGSSADQSLRDKTSFNPAALAGIATIVLSVVIGFWAGYGAITGLMGGGSPDFSALSPIERAQRISVMQNKAAAHLKKRLPMSVDGVTTLFDVDANGPTLQYNYRIATSLKKIDRGHVRRVLGEQLRRKVCGQSDMRSVMGYGGQYEYVYYDSKDRFIERFTISESVCG